MSFRHQPFPITADRLRQVFTDLQTRAVPEILGIYEPLIRRIISYFLIAKSNSFFFAIFPFPKRIFPRKARKHTALPFREPIPGKLLPASVTERHVFSVHTYVAARTYWIAGRLVSLPVCPTLGDLTGHPIGHGIQEIPVPLGSPYQ